MEGKSDKTKLRELKEKYHKLKEKSKRQKQAYKALQSAYEKQLRLSQPAIVKSRLRDPRPVRQLTQDVVGGLTATQLEIAEV